MCTSIGSWYSNESKLAIIPIWQIPIRPNNNVLNHLAAEDESLSLPRIPWDTDSRGSESSHTKAGNNSKNFLWTPGRLQTPCQCGFEMVPPHANFWEAPMWTHACLQTVAAHIHSSSQLLHCCLATPKTGAAHMSSTPPQLLMQPIFKSNLLVERSRWRDLFGNNLNLTRFNCLRFSDVKQLLVSPKFIAFNTI